FEQFVLSDHWDYRALEPRQLAEDPEPELTELVRRMAQGSFDYDVMSYYVVDRVVYANDYSYSRPYYDDFYYGGFGCGYYHSCGSRLSVSLFFGRPFYRRHYYGPYHYAYDPFYDPFFYDPWYYRAHYYRPLYHHRYHYGFYGYPYHYRNVVRPFTPYRFRDRTLVNGDYRDRRYTFGRAVNTVHTPPISRFSEPDQASPARRAVDRHAGERPEATIARRTADRGTVGDRPEARRAGDPRTSDGASGSAEPRRTVQRNESPTIEARRARPRETPSAAPDVRGRRENLPVDVSPRRSTADRSEPEARRSEPQTRRSEPEARRSEPREVRSERQARRSEPQARRSEPREVRSEPRSHDRGNGGGDGGRRAERAPSSSSGSSWSGGGGGRSGGGGGGGGGSVSSGGGRRR
ncbi:MAG: hypothetical protein ACREM9_14610, partial [Gemmatimonadales bacterium]